MPFGQAPMPMPFLPASDMFGKTRYKYVTLDGGPPMDGAVPSGSPFDPPQPSQFGFPGNCVARSMYPFGLPNPFAAPPCPFGAPTAPGWYQCTPAPPPYSSGPPPPPPPVPGPTAPSWAPPPPPPPASHAFGGTNDDAEEPLEGNRVKGQLATFPDRSAGYIFPRRNVTIHLFKDNVISKYPPVSNIVTTQNDKFNVQHAPCDMTFEELIEQINCRKRANWHPPYNTPGHGYPEHLIGVQELLELDRGRFMLGSKIMLTDPQAKSKLGELWSDSAGNAGQGKPRYIVRLPV